MKQAITLLFFVLISQFSSAQIVTIPDTNFKAALINNHSIDTNNDGEIQVSEAVAYTEAINVNNLSIRDLTGIGAFTEITTLNCQNNQLSTIDISNNARLEYLNCSINRLTEINVTDNSNLEFLYCQYNDLISLNLSNNPELVILSCGNNEDLRELDLSNNSKLAELYCQDNGLTSLQLPENIEPLQRLYCQNNSIGSLDLSGASSLTHLNCSSSNLSSLNVRNGNNESIEEFNASLNSLLACIIVDNATYSSNNWNNISSSSQFTESINECSSVIPISDAVFRSILVNDPNINTNNDRFIQANEAAAYTGTIDISGQGVRSISGIEAFTNLTSFDCSNNDLFSLLRISNLKNLRTLNCSNTRITTLDVSNLASLESLTCYNNLFTNLDLSQNRNLTFLDCSFNSNLESINIQNGNNVNITNFDSRSTYNLTCILVDNKEYSINNWTSIYRSNTFIENEELCGRLSENVQFSESNFKNFLLRDISINRNNDDEIQVWEAVSYRGGLDISNTQIQFLGGIEEFTEITSLNCSSTFLFNIDLSNNVKLEELICSNNNFLSSLNLQNNNNNLITSFDATNTPNLYCITVDNATYSTTNWTNIDNTTTFSESAEECRVLSTDDDVTFGEVKIYPNPVTDILTIESNTTTIKKVAVYNLLGSKMLESTESSLSVGKLPKGIYILKITGTENQQKNQRFVKL